MMDEVMYEKAERIARRHYREIVLLHETTEGKPIYFARTPELEGCFGQGKTLEDALRDLRKARIDYIYSLLEDNLPIPEPVYLDSVVVK